MTRRKYPDYMANVVSREYDGLIIFDKKLSQKEIDFFNDWQSVIENSRAEYEAALNQAEKDIASAKISRFLGFNLNDSQLWLITFAFSPAISFSENGMEVCGNFKKGSIREAILAYQHFFFNEDAVFKNCFDFNFIGSNKMNGYILCTQNLMGGLQNKWTYEIRGDKIFSMEGHYPKIMDFPDVEKTIKDDDSVWRSLRRYFPEILRISEIKAEINNKIERSEADKEKAPIKRHKV